MRIIISARKLTKLEQHDVSTTSCHHCQMKLIRNNGKNYKVIKKCRGKLECLIYEMLLIKNRRPKLNTQADSIRAKLFT